MRSPLIPKLNAVRRRHASLSLGVAVVAIVGLAVVALAADMALDRWLDLPRPWRAALLIADGFGLVAVLVWRGVLPVVRGPDLEQAALWVERAVPAFASRLISAVQLMRPAAVGPETSPGMVRALVRQAEAAAADVDFAAVVPSRPLKRLAIVTAGVVVALVAVTATGGRRSWAFAERAVLVPGVAYPHRTRVTLIGGDAVVARGDPVTISATATGEVPTGGVVAVRYGSGVTATLPAEVKGDRFDRPIDNVQEAFTYRFDVGDDESVEGRVRVATRPAVLGVRCRVTPPAYTGLAAGERSPWDLSLLAGSRLGLAITANVPAAGRVRFVGPSVDVPLVGDGTALTMADAAVPAGATGFAVELTSADGLHSRDPVVYRLDTVADRPPTVRLVSPAADGTVTPVAKPSVAVDADDDYGLARLSLRYRITHAGQTTAVEDDPNGLTATYGPPPGVTRTDPDVDINFAVTPPPADVGDPFPVRWTGTLRPAVSDDYRFTVHSTSPAIFRINGVTLINRPGQGEEGPVPLQAGRLYPIELSAVATDAGEIHLRWRGRHVSTAVVPHSCLFRRTDPYEPPPDTDGLVGYWPLDDVDTGTAHDAAGSADGTVYNATGGEGRIGRAAAFRITSMGNNAAMPKIEVPETPAMAFGREDSFSLCAWVRIGEDTGQYQAVVTKARDGGPYYGLWVSPHHEWIASGPEGRLVGPVATPGWHDVVLVQDGPAKRRTLYVDGAATVTGGAQPGDGWGPLIIGNVHDGHEPFDGSIDDVRLYARALPADQVRDLYRDPRPVRVPTAAEVGGVRGGDAATVPLPLPGRSPRHAEQRFAWDLAALPTRPAVGDTVEFWAEATDGNTVTGPGVAVSEHRRLRIVDEAEKRRELMGQLGDYLGKVRSVSDDQRNLTDKVGEVVGPTTRGGDGKKS